MRQSIPGKKQYFPGKNSRGLPTKSYEDSHPEPTTPRGRRRKARR